MSQAFFSFAHVSLIGIAAEMDPLRRNCPVNIFSDREDRAVSGSDSAVRKGLAEDEQLGNCNGIAEIKG